LPAAVTGLQQQQSMQAAMRARSGALSALVLVLAATSAKSGRAEDPPAKARQDPPEVRVIGDKADSLQKIPGSGTVITGQEINRADPYDVAEMLRRVPGVNVRQDEGGGMRLDIGLRGLDPGRSRRVLVLEDGIPIAVNPYAEPDLIYAPQIERMGGIEVVKGSGSILFGPQTIGGVVNFITLPLPARPHAVADMTVGNFGYTRELASFGDTVGDSARYVVQVFHKHGDGVRGLPFDIVDVFGKTAIATSDQGEATVKLGFHNNISYSDDVGLTREMYARDPRRTSLAPYDLARQRRYEASIVHEQRFSDSTKLRTLVYGYITTRFWRRQDYTRGAQTGTDYERIVGDITLPQSAVYFKYTDTVLDRVYQVAGVEPRLEHRFKTAGIGHTIDVGSRFLVETADYQQRAGDTPFATAGALDNAETHRTYALAAYLQDRIAFKDWLLFTPGFRVEHADYERVSLRQSDGVAIRDIHDVGDRSVTAGIPGVGMIAGSRAAHVFAGLHVGFAPPRLTDTISPKGQNVPLDSERSTNYELGTRFIYAKWLRAEGTMFLSNFTNQIVSSTGDNATVLVNGGATRHYGFEGGLLAALGRVLRVPTGIDLGVRYTYARAQFRGGQYDGNFLPYAPLYSVSSTLDVEHPFGIAAQIAWTHVSQQFTDSINTKAEDATGRVGLIPSYDIIDIGARYRHKPSGLSVKLTVKNALDNVYVAARRPEGIFASGVRQIMLGLRWDWEKAPPPEPEPSR
jgi:Fe(3+) dicitrate transport protein